MTGIGNKQLVQTIFLELSKGNDAPFIAAMADDMQWRWMGSGALSRVFDGKKAVLEELWSSVRKTLVPPFKVHANCIIAEGEYVVVEATGENRTPSGKAYHNTYCWVLRIKNKRIYELREYMDTDLVVRTFGDGP